LIKRWARKPALVKCEIRRPLWIRKRSLFLCRPMSPSALADIAPVVRSNERGRQLRRPQALDPTRKEVRVGPAYAVARVVVPRYSAKTKLTITTDEYRTCSSRKRQIRPPGVKIGQHLIDCTARVGGTRPRRCHIGSYIVRDCGSKQDRTKPSIEAA